MKNFTKIMYVFFVMSVLGSLDAQPTDLQLTEARSSLALAHARHELAYLQAQYTSILNAVQHAVPVGRFSPWQAQRMVDLAEFFLGKAKEKVMLKEAHYGVVAGALSVQEARNKVVALGMQVLENAWNKCASVIPVNNQP